MRAFYTVLRKKMGFILTESDYISVVDRQKLMLLLDLIDVAPLYRLNLDETCSAKLIDEYLERASNPVNHGVRAKNLFLDSLKLVL